MHQSVCVYTTFIGRHLIGIARYSHYYLSTFTFSSMAKIYAMLYVPLALRANFDNCCAVPSLYDDNIMCQVEYLYNVCVYELCIERVYYTTVAVALA